MLLCAQISFDYYCFVALPSSLDLFPESRELCAHPIMELYDNVSQRILFAGPLEQQNSFYVPEVLEEDEEEADMSSVGAAGTGQEEDDESGTESCSVRGAATGEDDDEGTTATAPLSAAWEKSASLLQDEGET